MPARPYLTRPILRVSEEGTRSIFDHLSPEEPLEIQLAIPGTEAQEWKTIAITMRTPGHDRELAVGFLVGEGLLRTPQELETVFMCGTRHGEDALQHRVRVSLHAGPARDLSRLQRNFYVSSSCGVCGKTSLEALEMADFSPVTATGARVEEALIRSLPQRLRESQEIFDQTGGLHAAGLFTFAGEPVRIREDVGRHNAVDKVLGGEFLVGRHRQTDRLLVVSGRASFELVQKTIAGGVPVFVAVGAPSSLAVELADRFGVTLIGFTKASGFNIYTHPGRIDLPTGFERLDPAGSLG